MAFPFAKALEKIADVTTSLKDHQKRVVEKMKEPGRTGLVVAHGLGSGKTLASIASHDALKTPATVVVPAALRANYEKERQRHLTGETQEATMESLQNAARNGVTPNDLLIVDEAHRARDPDSATFKALRDASAKQKMLLTASPFYNSPHDLAPLINIAAGTNVLPNDKAEFDSQYTLYRRVSPGLLARLRGVKPGEVQEINPRTSPRLRKVYDQWVDYHPGSTEGFPSVTREDVDVPMNYEQAAVYQSIIGQAPAWVARRVEKGLPPSKAEAKSLNNFLTGARQASLSTAPYVQSGAKVHETKIEKAFENLKKELDTNPEARAVVYSNFLEGGIQPYARRLSEAGMPFGEYTGEVKRQIRDQLAKDYNEGKKRVMLLSSAGGAGLDLKGTRLLQGPEPPWNR